MRVTDTARLLGVSASWLRRAERRGIIPPALRDLNGHRRFDLKALQKLQALVFPAAKQKGLAADVSLNVSRMQENEAERRA